VNYSAISIKKGGNMPPQNRLKIGFLTGGCPQMTLDRRLDRRLIGQTHAASRFSTEINADAEEVSRASRFATLAANTVFGTG
jgi:hypothetical protein